MSRGEGRILRQCKWVDIHADWNKLIDRDSAVGQIADRELETEPGSQIY